MTEPPLAGLKIVVTRSRAQAGQLATRLEALGAQVVEFPTIAFVAPDECGPLDAALNQLAGYDWIIFTSVNAVRFLWERAADIGVDMAAIRQCAIGAVGPATAEALQSRGVQPDLMPDRYLAEAIVAAMPDLRGRRILLPRASIAGKDLPDAFVAQSAQVDDVAVYQTVPGLPGQMAFDALLAGVDVIVFTSGSTARNFVELVGGNLDSVLSGALIACIGPVTGQVAREVGLPVHVTAGVHSIDGLLEAIINARGETLASG